MTWIWLQNRVPSLTPIVRGVLVHDIGPLEALAALLEAGQLGALVEGVFEEQLGAEPASIRCRSAKSAVV